MRDAPPHNIEPILQQFPTEAKPQLVQQASRYPAEKQKLLEGI